MSRRYRGFLVSLLAFLLVQPLAAGREDQGLTLSRIAVSVVITAILVSGMLASCTQRSHRIIGISLAALTFAVSWVFPEIDADAGLGWTDSTPGLLVNASPALFLFYTAGLTLRSVLRSQDTSMNRIFAALCVYLLAGFGFGLLYEFIWAVSAHGQPAFRVGTAAPASQDFVYFSFVTMTTLGYGDMTPVNGWARSLAVLQTILAVFYLAVLIARLVGSYGAGDRSEDAADR